MFPADQLNALEQFRREFRGLGYVGGLIQEDYSFADVLSQKYDVKRIPLAVFAQDPPSYRTAAFGVAIANGRSGPDFVEHHRCLGAPQLLELNENQVFRWKVTATGSPALLEKVELNRLSDLFSQNRNDWSPQQVLRAKTVSTYAAQLDFLDLNLIPLLDFEVRSKLDSLLSETVNLAVTTFEKKSKFTSDQYPPLFRLIFRLIASKVLADRNFIGDWTSDCPESVIQAVEDIYFKDDEREPVLNDRATQSAVWERIRNTFHFENLSVDSLAYVYENTLVTPNTRRLFGIHSTPTQIAEYIVRQLPFESVPASERRVFEPFSGHSVFLVAAMQRLRELLGTDCDLQQRHDYFVELLSGLELDDFAREVARLCLMLADYPNPDGWRLYRGDAWVSPRFGLELGKANIVLCNPPFESFTADERARYKDLSFVFKPAELLKRVLQIPPSLLGIVLPRVFLWGRGYKDLRLRLTELYGSLELLELPDRVFQHSEAESVLLLCSGDGEQTTRVTVGRIDQWRPDDFDAMRPSYQIKYDIGRRKRDFAEFRPSWELQGVWEHTSQLARLGDLSAIHRGVEYNIPFAANVDTLVADSPRDQFAAGLHTVRGAVEPFMVVEKVFLNISSELMRTNAHKLPWSDSKLVINASRRSRRGWKISASIDRSGLWCYQNFHAVWPLRSTALEVLAAVLNGPVANVLLASRGTGRHVQVRSLKDIPVPEFDQQQEEAIVGLVQDYVNTRLRWLADDTDVEWAERRCSWLLSAIDAEVLKAYDLPPVLERLVLDYFDGHSRPGPVDFTEYFPADFRPHIPWHTYISARFREAGANETLRRLPVVPRSAEIDRVLEYLK